MSLTLQTLFTNKNPTSTNLPLSQTHFSKLPKHHLNSKTHFQNYSFFTSQPHFFPVLAKTNASFQEPYETSHNQVNGASNEFNLDAFLSIIEFLSIASSAAVSVYVAFYGVQKGGGVLGSKILVLQSVVLVTAIVVGAVIRRRQWRRICRGGLKGGASSSSSSSSSGSGANLLMRVEKMEEDLRSSATIIRVLSRQLEKLGIRFRVTRKALKEPLAETAALAQKNSEATRALAAQEDILEKELGEIQKVLLAMQEQQQKQLELILAIGKAGKLWETNRVQKKDQNASETIKSSGDGVANLELNQFETLALQKEANNERP